MRFITAVTAGRSDWGIYRPVLKRIQSDPELSLRVIATGAHLDEADGDTIGDIRRDGFNIDDTIDMLLRSDSSVATSKAMGLGAIGFADAYQRNRPDVLLVLGDRFEMMTAVLAAVPFGIPIAHIHGGEVTHGAIDDAFRHAMTKCSHLHFASTQQHADRIVQLGEEPWRVHVSGAPSMDNLRHVPLLSRQELAESLQLNLDDDPLLVTFHPVTLQQDDTPEQIDEFVAALAPLTMPMVITRPNADPRHASITDCLEEFDRSRDNVRLLGSLGTQRYFSLMKYGCAMAGNSSSGIIEAGFFGLPVVNVGIRQSGRPRSRNVIDVLCERRAIFEAIAHACSPGFRELARQTQSIYGDGSAAETIVNRIKSIELNEKLIVKLFHDIPPHGSSAVAA